MAWNDALRSIGSRPARPEPGPGYARATITFGVVHLRPPFGNPVGYDIPVEARNGFVSSTPSSTIPIFIPSPRAPVEAQNPVAPISPGLPFIASRYVRLG